VKKLAHFNMSKDNYNDATYFTTTLPERKFFDGRLQEMIVTIDGKETSFFAALFIERDLIHDELVSHMMKVVAESFIPGAPLAFVINSQKQTVDSVKQELSAKNIAVYTMEQILSNVNFIALNPGVAFGFLRVFPQIPEDIEPYEIPVFSELPLELAVVAGAITTTYQDVGSHVNLKSKERGTPNMVVRNKDEVATLQSLDGKPVKLEVTYQGYSIVPSTADEVMQAYANKTKGPWQVPAYAAEEKIVNYETMCRANRPKDCLRMAKSYGGKVAGVGFLNHPRVAGMGGVLQKKFNYRITPYGLGIPLLYYNEFVKHNSDKNPEFKASLEKLISSEMSKNGQTALPTPEKKALIEKVKQLFLNGEIPPARYAQIVEQVKSLKSLVDKENSVDLEKVKVRSSANTEDIKGFNGAGLHDSYSAKIKKLDVQELNCRYEKDVDGDTGLEELDVKPKNLGCAIKGAYASLWNLTAVRERSFKKFDHSQASMGLSIQPEYKFRGHKIAANSVLVTRVIGTQAVYGQQLSTQLGNGLVTNPVANTKSELATITFDASAVHVAINILQYAKPVPDKPAMTTPVMSESNMLLHSEIARHVEVKYCESVDDYTASGQKCSAVVNSVAKPYALDFEFKLFDDNQILVKQVRSFHGK
jgi:Pyruvate phosphate dikinase, AMP/ATP-binding domain